MNILAQTIKSFERAYNANDRRDAALGAAGQSLPDENSLSSMVKPNRPSAMPGVEFSRAAMAAFEQGDPKLGEALHRAHVQTVQIPRRARTALGAAKEDGLRQIKDMLLVAAESPEMFARSQGFAARNGIPGAERLTPDKVPHTLAQVDRHLADPDVDSSKQD